jgi:hypothetical protein
MKKMDTNNDGVIEWKEFADALGSWLREESAGRDRKGSAAAAAAGAGAGAGAASARALIHKRISSFFLQFKRATNFNEIRAKMAAESKTGRFDVTTAPFCPPSPSTSICLSGFSGVS